MIYNIASLHDYLSDLKNDKLSFRVKLLEVKAKSQRKADMIDAIKQSLSGHDLRLVWATLKPLEQAAVAEACYASDLAYSESRFLAKYGSVPPFSNVPKSKARHYYDDSKYATRLNLFLYYNRYRETYVLPEDLAERLKSWVPEPSSATVKTIKAPEETEHLFVRETENEALIEVLALLRLAEQGDLRISEKTAMPSAVGIKKILQCLMAGDYFPPEVACPPNKGKYDQEIGAIKPVGWARMLKNAGYVATVGSKSKLTPKGIKSLSRPAHEIIEALWEKWVSNASYDEFNRVNDIKGQKVKRHMTAKPPRRDAILEALVGCPVGEWIELDQFSKYMQADGCTFEVSNNLWKLYLGDREYGSFGYGGCGGWDILQLRYILAFLFEYAAPLGLIDIAYTHPEGARSNYTSQWGSDDLNWLSRYDGLQAFRITPLGAYCLGMSNDFTPSAIKSKLTIEVLPSLQIQVIAGNPQPAEKLLLDTWAEPVSEKIWRLNPKRAREAVERGQNSSDLVAFLSECDDQSLPETVEGFLKNCESDGKALKCLGEAQLFKCRDAKTATMIAQQKELKKLCAKMGADQLVVPAEHLTKFRKKIKSLGLGVR